MTTLLLISSISYFLSLFIHHVTSAEQLVAAISSGMMFGLGIAIWTFYFRRQPGTRYGFHVICGIFKQAHQKTKIP